MFGRMSRDHLVVSFRLGSQASKTSWIDWNICEPAMLWYKVSIRSGEPVHNRGDNNAILTKWFLCARFLLYSSIWTITTYKKHVFIYLISYIKSTQGCCLLCIKAALFEGKCVAMNICGTVWEKGWVIPCYFSKTFVNFRNVSRSIRSPHPSRCLTLSLTHTARQRRGVDTRKGKMVLTKRMRGKQREWERRGKRKGQMGEKIKVAASIGCGEKDGGKSATSGT